MRKEKEKVLWNKMLADPRECIYCIELTKKDFPQLKEDSIRHCFYWIRHPDGKAHPFVCKGACEHFERKD